MGLQRAQYNVLVLGQAFLTTARRRKKTSAIDVFPLSCDHVNTSSVELLVVLTDIWPKYKFYRFYYRKIKYLLV